VHALLLGLHLDSAPRGEREAAIRDWLLENPGAYQ